MAEVLRQECILKCHPQDPDLPFSYYSSGWQGVTPKSCPLCCSTYTHVCLSSLSLSHLQTYTHRHTHFSIFFFFLNLHCPRDSILYPSYWPPFQGWAPDAAGEAVETRNTHPFLMATQNDKTQREMVGKREPLHYPFR